MLRTLGNFLFNGGYNSSSGKLDQPANSMSDTSQNLLIFGTGKNQIFKGITQRASEDGTQVMMNVGDDYAGLGNYNETGLGSVFRVLGAWFFIGTGSLFKNGVDTSADASTTLQIKKVESGSLGTTYQAGLAQPSAPTITAVSPPAGYTGKNNGVVSLRIARVRSATGARSNASLSSNVVQCTNQSVAATFPTVDANGQDYWEIDVTKNGEGAVGNHYFLQEIPEIKIASVSATGTLDADTTIGVPNDTLVSEYHVGCVAKSKQVETQTVVVTTVVAGNAKCVVTASGMSNSPKTVTFAVANNDTASQVATKARAALTADTDVASFFDVSGTSADIVLTAKSYAANDATMNVTIEDDTSSGITDDTTSTNTACGIFTTVTAVGADDSHSSGKQTITLADAVAITSTQTVRFTREQNGVERTYVFEWKDADIVGSDLAPIRDYPPPAGIFGGTLGDVVFVDGALGDTVNVTQYAIDNSLSRANTTTTYRGNAIAVSDPARPESFPPDNYIFTGDPPTALLPGGMGVYWRFSKNSLGVIRYVGGSPAITYERLWTGVGIQNQNNCVLGAGGRLYAYTGGRGAVRLGVSGEPDTQFAAPVADDMSTWTSSGVVLGYDANHQYVLYMSDNKIYAFHEPTETWCAPISLDLAGGSVVQSSVTVNGAAYIAVGVDAGADFDVYNFNVSGGTTYTGVLATPWIPSDGAWDVISRIHVAMRADTAANDVTVKVFTNGNSTSAKSTQTVDISSTGFQHLPVLKPNIRNAKSWRIQLTYPSAGGDAGFDAIRVEGETSGITF